MISNVLAQNQNISNGVIFDGEPYLSINPSDSQHMVISWMGWINFTDKIKIKTRTSFDGGETWSTAVEVPHIENEFTSADPSIAFNSDGEVFLSFVDFTGFDVNPMEGGIYIVKSLDGGLSWNSAVEVLNINADLDRRPIDRPWIVIDRSTGSNQGNIYITSMNAKDALPDFHPYLSLSTDNGNSFTWQDLDATDWLAGDFIPQPMPTPNVSASGIFHAIYPSYVYTQNTLPQYIIASSSNGGTDFDYHTVFATDGATPDAPLAKKGYLLLSNPSNPLHLAFFYLGSPFDDIDVFMTESFDEGITWSEPERINDDPIGNDRMQDLIWASFDSDGDLIVSWRDRRNGSNNSYETETEIWASYRDKDWSQFADNIQITSETIDYNDVLASSGNDFMCIKLQDDILHATWGDTRNGSLNIWFQTMTTEGIILSTQEIASEVIPTVFIYPNPTNSIITIDSSQTLLSFKVYDESGKTIFRKENINNESKVSFNLEALPNGLYLVEIETANGAITKKLIINK